MVLLCSSDDPDRIFPACMIALAALANETDVTMFFTMSGVNAVRKGNAGKVRKKGFPKPLGELLGDLRDLGARMTACSTSSQVAGMTPDDLLDGVEAGGAAVFVREALTADATLTF